MLRAILSVIAGYIVIAMIVVGFFTAMQLGLGTERVFRPNSYQPSPLFISAALVVSLIAAIVGGFTTISIARSPRPPMVLAGLVLALGLLSAAINLAKPDPGPRTGDISPMQAAQKAREPVWYALLLPVIGAGGVLLATRLRRKAA